MKNKSKTNWKIDENTTEKFNRYGIRKYNVGAASVAILSGLFFLGGADAQASENTSSQASTQDLKHQHKLLQRRVEVVPRLIRGKRL